MPKKQSTISCIAEEKYLVCSHAFSNEMPEDVDLERWFVAPMQLQSSYKYCTLMHVFAISKINLIIFAFLQQTVPLGDGWNRTTFEKSVPMSTYLVCFAVHQFTWVERTSASGKPVSPSAAWTWFRWQMCLHLHFFFKISFYTNRDIFFL